MLPPYVSVPPTPGPMGFCLVSPTFGNIYFGGLTGVGPGASTTVSVQGLDMPGVASGDAQRELDGGEFGGWDESTGRDIIVKFTIAFADRGGLDGGKQALGQAFQASQNVEVPLYFETWSGNQTFVVMVKVRHANFVDDVTPGVSNGIVVTAQFHATDSRIYQAPSQLSFSAPDGGFTYGTAENFGSVEMRPNALLTVTAGAPTQLGIVNAAIAGNPTVAFDQSFAVGDTLAIDLDWRTAIWTPASTGIPQSILTSADPSNTWWNLPYGVASNNIGCGTIGGDVDFLFNYANAYSMV